MSLYPEFVRAYPPETPPSGPVRWIAFRGRDLLVETGSEPEGAVTLPDGSERIRQTLGEVEPLYLGQWEGIGYLACDVPDAAELPVGWQMLDLWRLHGRLPEALWAIAGYGSQTLYWRRTSGFCPVCGSVMGPMQKEWMRACTRCEHPRYPPVTPATLILVHDGADKVLLSHQPGWGEMYSILAGFVLPGESLEECARREVEEEVGVQVTDLVYYGSQPWPFPHQMMIGFMARYRSGDIQMDVEELDRAEWFDVHELPPLPPTLSLSRQMLDAWKAQRLSRPDAGE